MSHTHRIAELNDLLRTTFLTGRVFITHGVDNHSRKDEVITAVREFSTFTEDNDPSGEHDFGAVEIDGENGKETFFWKIDYYDKDCHYLSEDPAAPEVTTRVLTIMLAEEY